MREKYGTGNKKEFNAEVCLGRELRIPESTEEKLEAAYDIVRARCRKEGEQDFGGEGSGESLKVKRRTGLSGHQNGGHRRRPSAYVALAAVLVLVFGLGAAAAAGYFTKHKSKSGNTVSYEFQLNYELKPVKVTAEPQYVPEGLVKTEEGKYKASDSGQGGFSVYTLNTAEIDAMRGELAFRSVERVEKKTIQNMEADLIFYQDADKNLAGPDILMFHAEEGYVLRLYGEYGISMDELEKIAENLVITVTEDPDGAYESLEEKERQEKADEALEERIRYGVAKEEIVKPKEPLYREELLMNAGYTVEEASVYDSLYDVPGYTQEGVWDKEQLEKWLDGDGLHKAYQRCHFDENGQLLEETAAEVKFLAVKVKAEQKKDYGNEIEREGGTALSAVLVRLEENEAGRYVRASDSYQPVPREQYELQTDGRCFYLDGGDKERSGEKDMFYRTLETGESLTYTMVFAVDEDILEQRERLVLWFDGTGNDPENPLYSALW